MQALQAAGLSVVAGCHGEASVAPAASPGFALYPPRSGRGLDPGRPRELAARLDGFRRHHRRLPARRGKGGLFILDLDELRRRFAGRWAQSQEKAYQLVEGALARQLGASDLYVALPGERFLLLLTDLERAAAERLARRAAAEITDRLCGMIPGGVACRVRRATIDPAAGLDGIDDLPALAALVEGAEAAAGRPADAIAARLPPALEAHYLPVLNLPKRLVSSYALQAAPRSGAAGETPAAEASAPDEEGTAALDRWAVAEAAARLADPSFRTAMLITLHYPTLANMRHRQQLMLACRRLPAGARRRLLVEFAGVPANLPQARLRELVSYLCPFTLGIVVRLESERLVGKPAAVQQARQALAEQLAGTGVAGLSLSLTEAAAAREVAAAPRFVAALGALAAMARQGRLRTFCQIGEHRRLCHAALIAGIDHVMGPALLPVTRRPGRPIALAKTVS